MSSVKSAFGAVNCVSNSAHPVLGARALVERQLGENAWSLVPPMIMSGNGADRLMESLGSTCTNESLRTERALKELDKVRQKLEAAQNGRLDTVGAVSIQNDGTALSCVSSGGILMKHDGRVGHSAQFGCAIWSTQVGDQSVSVSTSGCGEAIVRTHLAKTIAEDLLSSPRDRLPVEIVVDTVRRKFLHSPLLEIYPHERRLAGGLVMLKDADGMELVIFHNTQHFAFAYSDGKVVKHHISKLPPGADVICDSYRC